jgi:hypothetical protein
VDGIWAALSAFALLLSLPVVLALLLAFALSMMPFKVFVVVVMVAALFRPAFPLDPGAPLGAGACATILSVEVELEGGDAGAEVSACTTVFSVGVEAGWVPVVATTAGPAAPAGA